jgi:hypothetical protein
LQAGASDPHSTPRPELWGIAFGRLSLVIGDRHGALIDDRVDPVVEEDRARADEQHAAPQTRVASLERAVARASSATDKLEQVVNFIARFLQMKLDVKSLDNDAEDLIETAQHHSRDGRWDDVLELARALAMLLALLERWEELLQSLLLSIQAAEQLGDVAAEAWGHHELGTMHLLRGEDAKADRSLTLARKLRERIGDWDGLAATDFNLHVLCRRLRARLHDGHPRPPHRPLATLGLAVLMLVVGGAAGVAIGHTGSLKQASDHPASVAIELSPDNARAEQPVAFRATLDGHALASSYHWQFGDGSHSDLASPSHVYHYPGRYLATVTVATAMSEGTQIARGARTVIVAGAKSNETLQRSTTPDSIGIIGASPNPVPAGIGASKIAVKVLNQEGEPLSGQPVTFTTRPRDGALSASSVRSDSDGIAETMLSLTGSRTSTVKDTVEACATASACNTVSLEWQPQTTPVVVTLAASAVTATDATLNGTLNPNDTAIKSCYFQYGIGSYQHSAQCSPQPGEGSSPMHVSTSRLNLTPDTLYSFRLVANNARGQSSGEPQTFKTLEMLETKGETKHPTETTGTESGSTSTPSETTPTPADTESSTTIERLKPTTEKPTVTWLNESSSKEGERLEASVNPNGSEIEACYFEFEVGEAHEEKSCSPPHLGSGTKALTVTAVISNKASHFRVVAKNAGGTGEAEPPTFE